MAAKLAKDLEVAECALDEEALKLPNSTNAMTPIGDQPIVLEERGALPTHESYTRDHVRVVTFGRCVLRILFVCAFV
jgi:hypothetical protein